MIKIWFLQGIIALGLIIVTTFVIVNKPEDITLWEMILNYSLVIANALYFLKGLKDYVAKYSK